MNIENWLRAAHPQKIGIAIGFAVMLALVVAPGAYIQQAVFGLLDMDAYTLYAAVHGDAINRLPTFIDWLSISTAPEFMAISLAAAAFAVTRQKRAEFLFSIFIGVAVGLSVNDTVSAIRADALSVSYLVKNIIANLAGAAFVVCLAAVAILLSTAISDRRNPLIANTTVPTILGFVCSGIIYGVLGLFTHLMPVNAVISLEGAVSGYISRDPPSSLDQRDSRTFTLIPSDLRFKRLEITGSDDLSVLWERTETNTEFSLSVHLVDTCWSSSDLDEEPEFAPIFVQDNVKTVEIVSNATSKQIQVLGDQLGFEVTDSPISSFWVDNDQALSSVDITEFLASDARVVTSTDGTISIRLTGATLARSEDMTVLSEKYFTLNVDGTTLRLEILPPPMLNDEKIGDCSFVKAETDENGNFKLDNVVIGGVFLMIERTTVPVGYVSDTDGILHIENANGWLEVPDISTQSLNSSEGRVNFLSFSSPSSLVVIDGTQVDMTAGQNFAGFGNVYTRYRNDGVLLATGELKAAWAEGKRLNQTRWERVPTELRVALLTAFATFMLWASRRLIRIDWSSWSQENLL